MRAAFTACLVLACGTALGGGRPRIPARVFPPDGEHSVPSRAFVGIPSLAISPRSGRMWATWYAGRTPREDQNNYCVLTTSADGGTTWKEVLVADPDGTGPRRAFDPEVWVLPDGTLRWTWTDRIGTSESDPGQDQLWMLTLDSEREPSGNSLQPVYVGRGVMMCKPTVLSTGEWAFPLAHWKAQISSCLYISKDCGASFFLRGGVSLPQEDRLYDEHKVIERRNGDLWCVSRTKSGLCESVSHDWGFTWSNPMAMRGVKHTSSRCFITRLHSGNLLFVKHGPLAADVGRCKLTAYVSTDDGMTWQGGLLLDERMNVPYPDGQQTPDGTIVIAYDFDRTGAREVLFCKFREEDVMAGENRSGKVVLRQLITKSGEVGK